MTSFLEKIYTIEATIDDMNPQIYEYVMERLFAVGALEVLFIPVIAKKNRPAIILSCQAHEEHREALCDLILRETTTFGVRYYPVERKILAREIRQMPTKNGDIRVKIGKTSEGEVLKQIPEYEDVRKLAHDTGRPLLEIYQEMTKKPLDSKK
ncbi:MAG: DUF111 family protein [Deltaproteobacteria bacterium]|nr:DUF111 family protein [Deltaproteobacteria bacterium]